MANKANTNPQHGAILLFDDTESSRGLGTRLNDAGYQCFVADTPTQAFAQLNSGPVDVAVLDLLTPYHTGFDFLAELVQHYPETAVIAVSDDVQPELVVACIKLGVRDYLLRPFDLETAINRIEEVLRKRQIESIQKTYQSGLEIKVAEQSEEISKLYLDAVNTLVNALEAKDPYTAGHSRRVSKIAVAIAQRMGFSPEQMEDLRWGALLHDVGKLAVDPRVQNKADSLDIDEYAQIMQHIMLGPRIVKAIVNDSVLHMIKFHHRRYDSNALDISPGEDAVSTRIITLVDAFDAMTSDRPYRSGMTIEEAIPEIMRCSGTQFDPMVVAAFLAVPITELKATIAEDRV